MKNGGFFLFGLIALLLPWIAADEQVTPYPPLPGMTVNSDYRLECNGVDIPVYQHQAGSFAILRATGAVELTLERQSHPVSSAVLRPIERNTAPTVQAGKVSLRVTGPGIDALVLDADTAKPIFLFINPPETLPNQASVTHFFAPGKVYDLPEGQLVLKSGESVYIAGGAVVRGSIMARGKRGEPIKNIRISGQGLVDPIKKGQPLALMNVTNAEVEGLIFLNTHDWSVRLFEVSSVKLKGIHVLSAGKFSDGLDILGSKDVQVADSFFHSEDDCVTIKGEKFGFSGNVERITLDNVVVWKCLSGNGFEIGWELGVDYIKDITIRNSSVMFAGTKEKPFKRAAISMHNSGGAKVSHVLYDNITIEQASENLIHFWVGTSPFSKGNSKIGTIQEVTFRRVRYVDGAPLPSIFDSSAAPGNITKITFEGCSILGKPVKKLNDLNLELRKTATPAFISLTQEQGPAPAP